MTIYDVHGEPIAPVWIAEFCGFFLADGWMTLIRYNRKVKNRQGVHTHDRVLYHPRAGIVQRDDNRPLLEAICARLGGNITNGNRSKTVSSTGRTYEGKPMIYWYVNSIALTQRVVHCLRTVQLPYRGLSDRLDLMQEYIDLTSGPNRGTGYKHPPDVRERIGEIREALSRTFAYRPPS